MEAKYEMLINSQDHLLVKVTILYTVLRLSKVIINSLYCGDRVGAVRVGSFCSNESNAQVSASMACSRCRVK